MHLSIVISEWSVILKQGKETLSLGEKWDINGKHLIV